MKSKHKLVAGLVVLAIANATHGFHLPQTETYDSVQSRVVRAIDEGTEDALRAELLKREDRAVYSFGVALIDFYSHRMLAHQVRTKLPLAQYGAIRTRIKRCMVHDPDAGYPVALYAWFVDNFREPGLAEPERELLGIYKSTGPDGKVRDVPVYKVIADPAKRARVIELLNEALDLDKTNPLARYVSAAKSGSTQEAARLLWASMGEPGQYLWETDALSRIRFRLPDDETWQKKVAERVELLRAKIGKDSQRLRAYKF